MEINFKEGAPMELDWRTYPLSDKERKVLCNELNKDIAKGFIKHRTSSYISPVFFVPKKDGEELWMVIDYQKLNDITKKDFYPLPDLWRELEKLSKHSLFSKFDVRAGYNNIHIADKDQYKVAFKTPFGTFIPTVMTFGFCNAPSIFQQAMNWDLAELKQKYLENVSNYMDDVAIGTDDSPAGIRLHKEIIHCFLAILQQHAYFLKLSNVSLRKRKWSSLGSKSETDKSELTPVKSAELKTGPSNLKISNKLGKS